MGSAELLPLNIIVICCQNKELTIDPEVPISTAFKLKGTRATVNDSGKIVYDPFIRLPTVKRNQVITLSEFSNQVQY